MASNARKRWRYANDPVFRIKALERERRKRERARVDPAYRDHIRHLRKKWKTTLRRKRGVPTRAELNARAAEQQAEQDRYQGAKVAARAAWRYWLDVLAPDEWLRVYWANHPKPWTDRRLTKAQRYTMHYELDPEWRAKEYHRLQRAKAARLALVSDIGRDMQVAIRRLRDTAEHCHYCGAKLTKTTRTIDHVVPLSKGGAHTISNIVPACRGCNSKKNDRDLAEFIAGPAPAA